MPEALPDNSIKYWKIILCCSNTFGSRTPVTHVKTQDTAR